MSKRARPSPVMHKFIDKVNGSADKVERAVKRIRTGSQEALNKLSKVGEKFNKLQDNIGNSLSATAERVGRKFGAMRNKVIRSATSAADKSQKKFNALRDKISSSGSRAADGFNRAMTRIRTGSGKALGSVSKTLSKLGKKSKSLQNKLGEFHKSICGSQEKAAGCGEKLLGWGKKIGSMTFNGGKAMLDKTAAFEVYQSRLKILEGSEAKAKASMAWIGDFVDRTPHKIGEVSEAFIKMRAKGLDPTNGLMNSIGNASTVMNKSLTSTADTITGAFSGETKGLSDFGINATEDKKKKTIRYEYTDKQGKQQVLIAKKGDQKDIQKKLTKILDDKFGGAMADNAKTWNGMLDKLGDKWHKFQRMIMESGPFEKLKGNLGGLLDKISLMEKDGSLKALAGNIGQSISKAIENITNFGKKIYDLGTAIFSAESPIGSFIGGWDGLAVVLTAIPFLPVIGLISSLGSSIFTLFGMASGLGQGLLWVGTTILPALGRAFLWAGGTLLKFAFALLTNPITWIVAGIAALAAGAYLLYKNWEPISNYFSNLWTSLKATFSNGIVSILESIKGTIQAFPDWTLPEGLEAGNIDATIKKYRELGDTTGKLKPVDFRLPSMGEVMDDMGVSSIMKKVDTAKPTAKDKITNGAAATALSGMLAVSPAATAAPPAAPALNTAPVMAVQPSGMASKPVVMNVTVNVTPSPGMDEQAIGREVARQLQKLQHQAAAHVRSQLYDEV